MSGTQCQADATARSVNQHSLTPAIDIAEQFRHPRWRRSTFDGICLGVAETVGRRWCQPSTA
ncbi:MAG: hypothetical protein WCQ21_01765 [Verrucomicrobiota bacterium]